MHLPGNYGSVKYLGCSPRGFPVSDVIAELGNLVPNISTCSKAPQERSLLNAIRLHINLQLHVTSVTVHVHRLLEEGKMSFKRIFKKNSGTVSERSYSESDASTSRCECISMQGHIYMYVCSAVVIVGGVVCLFTNVDSKLCQM